MSVLWGDQKFLQEQAAETTSRIAMPLTYIRIRSTANGGDGGVAPILVVNAGINDVRLGVESASTIISAYTSYVNMAHVDGFRVVISTIMPYTGDIGTTDITRQTVNAAIRDGTIPADQVVDNAAYLPDDTDTVLWQSDQLHPTAAGYALLAQHYEAVMFASGALHVANQGTFEGSISTRWTITAGNGMTSNYGAMVAPTFTFGGAAYNGPASQQLPIKYSTSFSPSTSGWWRVYYSSASNLVGQLVISELGLPEYDEVSFHQFGGDVTITQLATGTDAGKMIDQVRLSTDGTNTAVDIHLNTSRTNDTVHADFMLPPNKRRRESCFVTPTSGASALSTAQTLTFSSAAGINTTGAIQTNVIQVTSRANQLAGTVTLSSGSATITSSAIDANTVIVFSLKTLSGTPSVSQPLATVFPGSATVTGLSTDNSTYNWVAMKVK